jgi:hypothetical protein
VIDIDICRRCHRSWCAAVGEHLCDNWTLGTIYLYCPVARMAIPMAGTIPNGCYMTLEQTVLGKTNLDALQANMPSM